MSLSETTFRRYVALGDSFTEGVGDPDESRPNGLRGWADRVAEVLTTRTEDFGYANLAIRGRKMAAIMTEQIGPAAAMRPDLITIYAGANDLLQPGLDLPLLLRQYDKGLAQLAQTGATVGIFTAFDPNGAPIIRHLRGRFAVYNEFVRELADKHGAIVLDSWRLRHDRSLDLWSPDRLHLGPVGHQVVAKFVLTTLGLPEAIPEPEFMPAVLQSKRQRRQENLAWARNDFLPWVGRRITGRSSGENVTAKRPSLLPIAAASAPPGT